MPLWKYDSASYFKGKKVFDDDIERKLRRICSKHEVKDTESFIEDLRIVCSYLRATGSSAKVLTAKQSSRLLGKFKNQSSKLLDTILEGQNPDKGIFLTHLWALGIDRDLLYKLEKSLEQLPSTIQEAEKRVGQYPPALVKSASRCRVASEIYAIFKRFKIPIKHHEESDYYNCIRYVLISGNDAIESVRSFMSHCQKITQNKHFYKPVRHPSPQSSK